MWEQFWAQNIDYVIQVFIAFWMITACWIYLDGWFVDRQMKTLARAIGFFVLTLWAFLEAVPTVVLSAEQAMRVGQLIGFLGLVGFGIILLSLLVDPIPVKPNEEPIRVFEKITELERVLFAQLKKIFKTVFEKKHLTKTSPPPLSDEIQRTIVPQKGGGNLFSKIQALWDSVAAKIKTRASKTPPPSSVVALVIVEKLGGLGMAIRVFSQRIFVFFLPFLTFTVAILTEPKVWMLLFSSITTVLVWLHYTKGIQSEWKYFYRGFLWITMGLALSLTSFWQNSPNVLLAQLLAPFHAIWILENIIKLIGAALLGMWAWGFIRFRLFPQVLSSFVAFTFIIFMSTTIIYTGFLLKRIQDDAIVSMEANIKTVDFALSKIKDSAILAARIASINPQLREAVRRGDQDALFQNLNTLVFENETDFMLVVNTGGEILMRAEDRDRFGDSIAEDPVVWRALDGKAVVTTVANPGLTIPTVSIRAASPIIDTSEAGDLEIIGAVITGFLLDTAFVDGMKQITDLEITVFADDIRSATTLVIPESQFRLIGTRELDQKIIDTVLKKGETYTGTAMVYNQSYLSAYIPIKDIEETEIGMFFTGRSHASILNAASETMRLTFVVSIFLMLIALFLLWWVARFIAYHQKI